MRSNKDTFQCNMISILTTITLDLHNHCTVGNSNTLACIHQGIISFMIRSALSRTKRPFLYKKRYIMSYANPGPDNADTKGNSNNPSQLGTLCCSCEPRTIVKLSSISHALTVLARLQPSYIHSYVEPTQKYIQNRENFYHTSTISKVFSVQHDIIIQKHEIKSTVYYNFFPHRKSQLMTHS